jgi:DNA topoisomerase-1
MATRAKKGKAGKSLVVVESPAKARTIARILGDDYIMKASQGHVRDLPSKKLGVDIERDFEPQYFVSDSKQAIVTDLKKAGNAASTIYLATDPDREGESISWHIAEEAGWNDGSTQLQRVVFHEITPSAVKEAFEHPRELDMDLVGAQQARRILDRLVGYQISPLLSRRVQRGLSAGRVQSVALRLVVDREQEIQAFVPVESWTIEAQLLKTDPGAPAQGKEEGPFDAVLHSVKGQKKKLSISNETNAREIEGNLKGASYKVAEARTRETKQSPAPPFITSTLQQEAWRKLRLGAKRTMSLAQQLYEGVSLGTEGPVGLITYMRTDSTNVASSALAEARDYIGARYGKDYLPAKPRTFRGKVKGAQEAHEAIRPTSVVRDPGSLRPHLNRDQLRLYQVIWSRMVASQMAEAISDNTTADIDATCKDSNKAYMFRATGTVLKFPGFRTLYLEGVDDEDDENKDALPVLAQGTDLSCLKLDSKQHFTQPPARYTEASLVKALEERGIGRPSTYAPIVSTLQERNYVARDSGRLSPTALGTTVCQLLNQYFTDIMDVNFTARMEDGLDEVARGEREWVRVLREFYEPFKGSLDHASEEMPRVRVEEPTEETCDQCGRGMVIKTGRFGRFMACSGYPECKNRRPLEEKAAPEPTEEVCDQCGQQMVIKTGRYGKFMACSGYPTCKNRRPLEKKEPDEITDEACQKCGKPMAIKMGKYGKFMACTGFPKCRNIKNIPGESSGAPTDEMCDDCGRPMVMKKGRYGPWLACTGYPECRGRKKVEKKEKEPDLVGAEA